MPVKNEKYLSILIAEDEIDIATLVSSVLRGDGHSVDIAGDGQEALTKMTENRRHYDLLITDSSMPRMSGFQLVEKVRKHGFPGKIIMASAFKTLDPEAVHQTQLVDRIVHKPYLMVDLQQAVGELYPIPEVGRETVLLAPTFAQMTRIALWQFILWATLDIGTTCIGLQSGFMEGNPVTAWTVKLLGASIGMIAKELLVTVPLCIGGGYVCFWMAKSMSLRRRRLLANLPVYIGVFLHGLATLNNLWIFAS